MSLSLQPGCKSLECATVMSGTVESWKNYGLAKKKYRLQLESRNKPEKSIDICARDTLIVLDEIQDIPEG